jgi:hypothetical protein
VDQIFGATQKLKNQWQKKECLEYFFNTKTYVCKRFDFGPLRLKKNTDKNNQRKDSATQQVLTNRHLCTTHNQ